MPPEGLTELLATLGWEDSDLDPALPPRVGFAGNLHPILAAATRERLAELDYDFNRLAALVIDRGQGVAQFRKRTSYRNAIRLGAAILVLAPFVQFAVSYVLAVGSFAGFIEYLPMALLESAAGFVMSLFTDPLRAVLVAGVGTVLWWIAFGFPRRRR